MSFKYAPFTSLDTARDLEDHDSASEQFSAGEFPTSRPTLMNLVDIKLTTTKKKTDDKDSIDSERAEGTNEEYKTSKTPAQWVRQLGDEEFLNREAASCALAELGALALPELGKALSDHDLEIRRRAKRIVGRTLAEERERRFTAALYTDDPSVPGNMTLLREQASMPSRSSNLTAKSEKEGKEPSMVTDNAGLEDLLKLMSLGDAEVRSRLAQLSALLEFLNKHGGREEPDAELVRCAKTEKAALEKRFKRFTLIPDGDCKLTAREILTGLSRCDSLEQISLTGRPGLYGPGLEIQDRDAKLLQRFTGLKELKLCATGISAVGLQSLAHLKNLRRLDLSFNDMTKESIEAVAKCKQLNELRMAFSTIEKNTLTPLKEISGLRILCLRESNGLTDRCIQALSGCVNLEELDIGKTEVTGDGLRFLPHFKNLTKLRIDQCDLQDKGMGYIGGCKQLRELSMIGVTTSKDFSALGNLSKLERLELNCTKQLRTNDLRELTKCQSLRHLELFRCPVDDATIAEITPLKKLEYLGLDRTKVTEKALKDLNKLPSIREIRLSGVRYVKPASKPDRAFDRKR